jgi:hypothetical protein
MSESSQLRWVNGAAIMSGSPPIASRENHEDHAIHSVRDDPIVSLRAIASLTSLTNILIKSVHTTYTLRLALAATLLLNVTSQLPRSFAANRLKRPVCASCAVESGTIGRAACAGIGALSLSRLCLMKTRCQLTSWHSEHLKVWCSLPRTIMVSSLSTFINIIPAPHAIQRIARTRSPTAIV